MIPPNISSKFIVYKNMKYIYIYKRFIVKLFDDNYNLNNFEYKINIIILLIQIIMVEMKKVKLINIQF